MKKYIKYAFLGLGLATLSSCINTLDTKPTSIFDTETVWGSKATIEGFVKSTYNDVLSHTFVGSGSCTDWEARTPNGVRSSQVGSEGIDKLAVELGVSAADDWSSNCFGYLRAANQIIANVQASSLSAQDKKELSAHGYMLRGLVFFNQARLMGRLVPVMEVFDVEDKDKCKIPMTKTPVESYKYVISDLQKAAEDLPDASTTGMPNKWAAKVLLSRAALQAYAYTEDDSYLNIAHDAAQDAILNSGRSLTTSDGMFNEKDMYNQEILWGYYRLKDNSVCSDFREMQRSFPNVPSDDCNNSLSPVGLKQAHGNTFECWGYFFPTQDLVDQYLVNDDATGEALPWYETSQYKNNVEDLNPATLTGVGQIDKYVRLDGTERNMPSAQDFKMVSPNGPNFARYGQIKPGSTRNLSDIMYSNRDKRFYTNIVYDNCTWLNEHVDMNLGGNLSRGVRYMEDGGWYNTTTGYYWRKNMLEDIQPRANSASKVNYHYNVCRLGEAYLNLAEACLLKGEISEAVSALNATRTVHGGLKPSTANTAETAWADYIRERNCEMTNESADIYFSYLRWGKYGGFANEGSQPGDVVKALNRPVYIMQIDRKREVYCVSQLTILNSASRTFTTRRYVLPINQGFLDTRAAYGIVDQQNAGW